MSEFHGLWARYAQELEDFWGRRENRPRFYREYPIWGRRVCVSSNQEGVLQAMEQCAPLYSLSPLQEGPAFFIQMVVRPGPIDPGPPPDALVDHMQFTGDAAWLTMQLGLWGHCFLDMAARRAVVILAPSLAARPDLVGRALMNTVLTNFFIGDGYALLHASCLVREGRALLLMAPHNAGKSTTSLRLALGGYRLLTDSMVFLPPAREDVQLLGFSVGRLRLRPDMAKAFPQFREALESEPVRGELKYALDLRQHAPHLVHQRSLEPERVTLMLLARNGTAGTRLWPATRQEAMEAAMMNSLFYDTKEVWQANVETIARLVERAELYHLSLGTESSDMVAAVDGLWEQQ